MQVFGDDQKAIIDAMIMQDELLATAIEATQAFVDKKGTSHVLHLLCAWQAIKQFEGQKHSDAFILMDNALYEAKRQLGKLRAHSLMQNTLWFGIISQAFICDQKGGKDDFYKFVDRYPALMDKALLPNINRLVKGGELCNT